MKIAGEIFINKQKDLISYFHISAMPYKEREEYIS